MAKSTVRYSFVPTDTLISYRSVFFEVFYKFSWYVINRRYYVYNIVELGLRLGRQS